MRLPGFSLVAAFVFCACQSERLPGRVDRLLGRLQGDAALSEVVDDVLQVA
jgi:hypothetical protein